MCIFFNQDLPLSLYMIKWLLIYIHFK
jgi:hypothetical protein